MEKKVGGGIQNLYIFEQNNIKHCVIFWGEKFWCFLKSTENQKMDSSIKAKMVYFSP